MLTNLKFVSVKKVYILIVACFLLSLFSKLSSQTLVNTEKFEFLNDKKYSLGAELTYDGSFGNSDVHELSSSLFFGYKFKKKNLLRLMGGLVFLSEEKEEIQNDGYLQLRYNYIISPIFRTFHFYQIQHNITILLERRDLLGSGIRITVFPKDSTLVKMYVGIGAMYETEKLLPDMIGPDDKVNSYLFRMANYFSFRYDITPRIKLLDIVYYQPAFNDFTDYRLLNEFSMVFSFTEKFLFQFSFSYRRDSKPPSTLEKEDWNIFSGIIVNL